MASSGQEVAARTTSDKIGRVVLEIVWETVWQTGSKSETRGMEALQLLFGHHLLIRAMGP